MGTLAELELGRQAHGGQVWGDAFALLTEADSQNALSGEDLERLAEAASMLGRGDDDVRLLRRAFLAYADEGQVGSALRCGYWLCKSLAWAGEFAQGSAWLARLRRLAEAHPDCEEYGYLLLLEAELLVRAGEYADMLVVARRLADVTAERGDPDLAAGAGMTLGNALIINGRVESGLTHLDEAMVAVTEGELSARATGMIYCVVIGTCQELYELRRAREWSTALAEWCSAQPEFTGAYRGLCRVHRVTILQLGGGWPMAVREAQVACQQLTTGYGEMVAGAAFYQLAELHRLRGERDHAEQAYREALRYGWDVQPGLALLRLAQGRNGQAAAAIRRAVAEAADVRQKARVMPAAVDVLLAVGDLPAAAHAADELARIAEEYDTTALHAVAAHAVGAVRLAEGAPEHASAPLRRAFRLWRELDVPHEVARARVLIASACRALGDEDGAAMELDAARQVFVALGPVPDIAGVDRLRGAP
jgi:tetratricopeptide (TPR) repeat protein